MPSRMFSRRQVLKMGTAATVGLGVGRRGYADLLAHSAFGSMPFGQLKYSQVTLLPGPMRTQLDQNQQFLQRLDNDMILKPFRQGAGLDAPGDDMGGWYSNSRFFNSIGGPDGYVPGHCFGQWMSALSRAYAISGDRETQAKVEQLVAGLQPTLVSKMYEGHHTPGYLYDKLSIGLLDAGKLAGVTSAVPAMRQALDAAQPHLPEKALSHFEMHVRPHRLESDAGDETYTLPENFFLAYQATGDAIYREMAERFLEDDLLFNPLAEDIDVLPGEHAYSHVNAFSSAMQAYLSQGSEKHLRAAKNGFRILQKQSFATGGWGPGESLLHTNSDDLARSLYFQPSSFETPCGAYAHFKITRYLLRVTGDSLYGDSMERVLYNTVLGAKPLLEDGSTFYYSDYTMDGRKTYHHDKWPCCAGTLPQIATDYGISSYFPTADGLLVNLYVPSAVTWKQDGVPVTLTQETLYPFRPTTRLTVRSANGREFTLRLRIPAWAGPATRVLVNGKAIPGDVVTGSFYAVRRAWRNKDYVEVEFDMPTRIETLDLKLTLPSTLVPGAIVTTPGVTQLAALMSGPVVFMATGHWPIEMQAKDLLAAAKVSGGDAYDASTTRSAIRFKPFLAIQDELYRTYQPLKAGT